MDRTLLERKALSELRQIASTLELRSFQRLKKAELIDLIMGSEAPATNGERRMQHDDVPDSPPTSRDESEASSDLMREQLQRAQRSEESGSGGNDDIVEQARDGEGEPYEEGTEEPERQRERTRSRAGGLQSQVATSRRSKRDRRRKGRDGTTMEDASELEVREGILDLLPEGYGFLRVTGYLAGPKDVYVSQSLVRRYGLRRGDRVAGPIRHNKGNDKFPALLRVDSVEGELTQENPPHRVDFKDLTPYFPRERLRLETPAAPVAMRIVDMIAPVGKGQRGLIVSPPKAGKTTILKQLANAIETNNPEVDLMVLLVDERPEEVTDFERSTKGTVISSTFDRPADDHTQVAELTIERAKRLVERGRDVVVLLDSITRLARAYNLAAPASGRILSGGVDSAALYPPKRFFGAARNIEEGGSLTIIATALVETGSKMDEVIFEEFKGTGNMELRLDRKLEQKRIFPAVDIESSGTRKEELLLSAAELEAVWKLRRVLASLEGGASLELLIDKLRATRSNEQFLQLIQKSNLG
ncbi:MAG: transcription termination factor Rho [Nitriliruptorales bacterium]